MSPHFLLCLPTSCWSRRSKPRSEGLVTVKHNGDEAFLFYFPVSTQTQQESGFIVFLQYDTSSRFKLILSPSVCDFSVADFSDLPQERAFIVYHSFVGLFICWLLLSLYPRGFNQQYLQRNSFVRDTGLDPGGNLEISKRHSCLLEAYSLVGGSFVVVCLFV